MLSVIVATAALQFAVLLPAGLERLVLEGPELHPSLTTRSLADDPIRHVPGQLVRQNPQLSAEAGFVRAITAAGSQGNLAADGVIAALFALYAVEKELGFYGLEASTTADASRLEAELRRIWAHNVSLDRARVHRADRVLLVVWTDGVPPEVWQAVNGGVAERLRGAAR
jgi:hypothetical protein